LSHIKIVWRNISINNSFCLIELILDLFLGNAWSVPVTGLNYLKESGKFVLYERIHVACFNRYRMVSSNVNVNIKLTWSREFFCLLGNGDKSKAGIKKLYVFLCVGEDELKVFLLAALSNVFGIKKQSHYAVTRTYIKNFTTVYGARNLFMVSASFRPNRERLLKEIVKTSKFVFFCTTNILQFNRHDRTYIRVFGIETGVGTTPKHNFINSV
jgi:hypothetical protein